MNGASPGNGGGINISYLSIFQPQFLLELIRAMIPPWLFMKLLYGYNILIY